MGLETVELVLAIEEEFAIAMADDEAAAIVSLGDLRDRVLRALADRGESTDVEAVWERVRGVMRREFAVPEGLLVPESRIVDDLGLD